MLNRRSAANFVGFANFAAISKFLLLSKQDIILYAFTGFTDHINVLPQLKFNVSFWIRDVSYEIISIKLSR